MCSTDLFLGLLALLFPPLPVWVKCGVCSADSIINILLCMLGYLPGLIHAWYIIAKFPEPDYEYRAVPYDSESGNGGGDGGRVYVYVGPNGQPQQQPRPAPDHQPSHQHGMSYGTNGAQGHGHQGPSHAAPQFQNATVPPPTHHAQPSNSGGDIAGPSSSGDYVTAPPSYAQVIAGDNKVQNHD